MAKWIFAGTVAGLATVAALMTVSSRRMQPRRQSLDELLDQVSAARGIVPPEK